MNAGWKPVDMKIWQVLYHLCREMNGSGNSWISDVGVRGYFNVPKSSKI